MSIGIAIPTYQAERHIPHCLGPLSSHRVLVIDSSSTDRTAELAKDFGAEVIVIPKSEFNHGLTREKARKHLGTDIIVFLTQDAYMVDPVEKLTEPIINGKASVAYARQVPHVEAGFFESFHREFNYTEESQIRTLSDKEKYGVYTCFCSDSCAAYSNKALDEIGGFQKVRFGEDTIAVAKLLLRGHSIAYVADATVRHSHSYGLFEEFSRHVNIGQYRKEHSELLGQFGADSERGRAYVKQMMRRLLSEKPHLIPYAFLQTLMKWLGYKWGQTKNDH